MLLEGLNFRGFVLTIWNINLYRGSNIDTLLSRFVLTIWNINHVTGILEVDGLEGFVLTIWNINTCIIVMPNINDLVLY